MVNKKVFLKLVFIRRHFYSPLFYSPSPVFQNGITPIAYAIGGNHLEVVKGLMQIKADPHNVDVGRNSGLHYAAGYGRKDLVEFLLNSGADANKANAQGQTPFQVASRNKQAVTMKLLESAGGK